MKSIPFEFKLHDGTHVIVYRKGEAYEFFLTRLNSEKHNFLWIHDRIEEAYETRFDELQKEAIEKLKVILKA